MRVVVLHAQPFLVPGLDLVPFLVARSGDVVRTRPAAASVSPASEPQAAAVCLLHHRPGAATHQTRLFTASHGCRARCNPVETWHRHGFLVVAAAIVVELQRLADFRHQRVHFFGVDRHRLLQKDVVFLSTRHFQSVCRRLGVDCGLKRMNESSLASRCSRHAARLSTKSWVVL